MVLNTHNNIFINHFRGSTIMMHSRLFRAGIAALMLGVFAVPAAPAQEMKKGNNIVETAIAAGSFKTLVTALTEAGLVETLQGEGPFTVFAPTDEAFAKIPKASLDALLKDKDALKNVLLYHVVSGKVPSADVVKMTSANTVEGASVKIALKNKEVFVNDAKVIKTDIAASNGIIHVIDAVIMPPPQKVQKKLK